MVLNVRLPRNRPLWLSLWWSIIAYTIVLKISGPTMSTASQLQIQLGKSSDVFDSYELEIDDIEMGNETPLNHSDVLTSVAVLHPSAEIRAATLFGADEDSKVSSIQSGSRQRRDVFHGLLNMMKCTTQCDPLSYKGYGCYCGFLGSGPTVDAIDRCCQKHDYCYGDETSCRHQSLVYFVPYKWKCNGGHPYCVVPYGEKKPSDICAHHLCECDRQFAECLRYLPCPGKYKAACPSNPLRSLG